MTGRKSDGTRRSSISAFREKYKDQVKNAIFKNKNNNKTLSLDPQKKKNKIFEIGFIKQKFNKKIQMKRFQDKKSYDQMRNEIKQKLLKENDLSVINLKQHIMQNHSKRNIDQNWSYCKSTKTLFDWTGDRKIPQFMKDVGLGPSIYLLTLQNLSRLFMFITLIHLPVFFLFYAGDEKDYRQPGQVTSMLNMFSKGNLGQHQIMCSEGNLVFQDNDKNDKKEWGKPNLSNPFG